MISQYSINYPALASIAILVVLGLYHWLMGRRDEYDTLHLPSATVLTTSQQGICIHHESDLSVNNLMHFDQLICKNLYVGPYACLQGNLIRAQRIVIDGEIKYAEQIVAQNEIVNNNFMEAHRVDTPAMTLGKKSVSIVQIVPKQTQVTRKKSAQTRGFFSSSEELEQSRAGTSANKLKSTLSSVRLLRKTPR